MNQASDMLVIQSLFFWGEKVAIFRKRIKIYNFLYSIKQNKRQNKELKYRQKIQFEEDNEPGQLWIQGKADPDGYYTLENSKSQNLMLTAISKENLEVKSK